MRKFNQLIRSLYTINWVNILILLIISGCAQQDQGHEHDETLSGIWEYHSVYFDPEREEYVDSHVHVKLTDDGNEIHLDHCLHDKQMSFTRNENVLTNKAGQSLEIIHEDKIATVDMPQVSHLVKSNLTHDLQNAGSISIQSDLLPELNLSDGVCAQRTQRENDENILLHISLPFEASFIDMTLEVDNQSLTLNNLVTATFRSPKFVSYYGREQITALSGKITFTELSDTKAKFDFDIKLQGQYNNFIVDNFVGSADITL